MPTKKKTTDASKILHNRFYKGKPERIAELAQTRLEMALGEKIYRLREEAGWTQKELADQIGTQASAISRIEDADYDSHSYTILKKVADALDMRLIIDFVPKHPTPHGDAKEN